MAPRTAPLDDLADQLFGPLLSDVNPPDRMATIGRAVLAHITSQNQRIAELYHELEEARLAGIKEADRRYSDGLAEGLRRGIDEGYEIKTREVEDRYRMDEDDEL